jgi:hypothetical protein
VGLVDSSSSSALERFFSLIRRDLGAKDVRVVASAEEAPQSSHTLFATLPDERVVVIVLPEAPTDAERDVLERRLGMLVDSFADALEPKSEPQRAASRVSVPLSLHGELRALAARAGATDVVVIDVDSPVVWGSALKDRSADDHAPASASPAPEVSRPQLVSGATDSDPSLPGGLLGDGESPRPAPVAQDASQVRSNAAIALVRKLPYVGQAHKGRHFRHAEASSDLGVLALSFSGIYVLILVFEGDFDELRAERAASEALPRIERLVLALPPFDPEPTPIGDAMALRRPRRR